jgi:hypothetical protein
MSQSQNPGEPSIMRRQNRRKFRTQLLRFEQPVKYLICGSTIMHQKVIQKIDVAMNSSSKRRLVVNELYNIEKHIRRIMHHMHTKKNENVLNIWSTRKTNRNIT